MAKATLKTAKRAAGGDTVRPPENFTLPSLGEVLVYLKDIKTVLDTLVALLGAVRPQAVPGVDEPCKCCPPPCPDAVGVYMLVCDGGEKSWLLVPSALAAQVPTQPADEGKGTGDGAEGGDGGAG